jgi:hypothetical protein
MDNQGEWLTLQVASQRLGVSIQTLRRKIKKGKLESRQVESIHGMTYEVCIAPDYHTMERVGWGSSPKAETSGNREILALLHKLQDENRELHQEAIAKSEACAMWQARAEMVSLQLTATHEQLRAAQQTIKMLEAPKVEPVPEESKVEDRPWWKIW